MSNLQSILYELKPCDISSPYVFISYSSQDSELVWQDVREFQKRGYNVWIDEKNLCRQKKQRQKGRRREQDRSGRRQA